MTQVLLHLATAHDCTLMQIQQRKFIELRIESQLKTFPLNAKVTDTATIFGTLSWLQKDLIKQLSVEKSNVR